MVVISLICSADLLTSVTTSFISVMAFETFPMPDSTF